MTLVTFTSVISVVKKNKFLKPLTTLETTMISTNDEMVLRGNNLSEKRHWEN